VDLDMLLAAVQQLQEMVRQENIVVGHVPHVLQQLETVLQDRLAGYEARIEQKVTIEITEIQSSLVRTSRTLEREVDNANLSLAANIEEKTSRYARRIIDQNQLYRDVLINAVAGKTSTVQASGVELTPKVVAKVENDLGALFQRMINEKFSPMLLKEGFERLRIQDAAGHVFDVAIQELFAPNGPVAVVALKAVSSSPDFNPAMAVLFGPSGKVADAATDAAAGANLSTAEHNLEKKLEEGVNQALDQAGSAAKEHAAVALANKVSSGATALGNVMTSIPQLYDSVSKLGEAWDKPLHSTKDYMDLLASAGGAVSQAGQVLQAFAGITQIAAAAQAVFNAIMALNPVVLVVIAVVVLIAAIVLLIMYWDQVKAALRDNPWLAVAASLFGIIGIIIVIIAYWDEIKLAVLVAANFISIQAQRIGWFFVGVGTVIGQVWDVITASVANVGIAVVNAFITAGAAIQNFFIGVINWVLGKYNELADSALGDLMGLEKAALIPEVDVQTKLIPPRDVPKIDVQAAFSTPQIAGGLESQITTQRGVVAAGQEEDAKRRAQAATAAPAATAPPGMPAVPGATAPALPAPPGGIPAAPPALPAVPGGVPLPAAVPAGPGGAAAAGGTDASVHVEGGITVNVNAERLEADTAKLLTDQFIAQIQARLGDLRATQDFRVGARPQVA
jgi:hypothetical protein